MATAKSHKPASDDDEPKSPVHKKGRDIKPLHEEELKKKLAKDQETARANAEVLEELAKKTAELAGQVKGDESPQKRTLILEQETEPRDIFADIDDPTPSNSQPQPIKTQSEANPAADLIREKLGRIYGKEPAAADEAAESIALKSHRSKHQKFMYDLTTSGKSLAEIQTAWHEYYIELPDNEKHQVWQEFYQNQSAISRYARETRQEQAKAKQTPRKRTKSTSSAVAGSKSMGDIKAQILDKVSAGGKLKTSHHLKSALFGLGLATAVGLFIAIVFFNQVFIAPFISPSRNVSATPIVGVATEVGPEPKIIIPKINLEVPIVYDVGTTEERAIQNALEEGVVHYATSPEPGQLGNTVIVGHSSNNILNSGRYKFAFVLLSRMESGDTFFVQKDGVRYTYKVYKNYITTPQDVSVLYKADRENTITLITCDPPGTSINRRIIVAEQISPDPAGNKEASVDVEVQDDEPLPGNAQSLWSRLTGWM